MELDASATDLSVAIVGTPPSWVIAWADATLARITAHRGAVSAADDPDRSAPARALAARAVRLASAAAAVVRAIGGGSHRRLTCFVARDGAYERRPFAALPVTLGPAGVASVHVPQLSARERVALGE